MIAFLENLTSELIGIAEWLMLIFVIGGGTFLVFYSRFTPYRYFKHALQITAGKYDKHSDPGDVSHYQALAAAVAATVGLGNISGVAIAIHHGGPGVVFWMWVTAIIGMCIKFYSCSLAVMFRSPDTDGGVLGGPMYYMMNGLGKYGKPLAVVFSVAGLVGVLPAFTTNQLTETLITVVQPDTHIANLGEFTWRAIIGVTLVIITSFVIFGGLKNIAKASASLVPWMVALYMLAAAIIIITNIDKVLPTFKMIFVEAFNFNTAIQGGLWGIILLGIRRAVFSSESGVGNAPMYHGQSKTNEPVQEGLVAMLGPFIDTVVICTITALIILVSGAYLEPESNGISLTLMAFERSLYGWGAEFLMVLVVVFAISTLFTYSYYGTKCLTFLTKSKKIGGYYNYIYIISIIFAAIASLDLVINLIDLAFAVMTIPNMIAVLYLAPHINAGMKAYFSKATYDQA
ncbi:alanine/glycine:cation symporter family protein [Robertkochia sediminum]|uniref:alanine/glycine:cation symporter family protein n=1 Tax=Robertkochia sediminum TaxID=2785326 RepID=UPI0019335B8A|nr:alanine/glycine:cation symporter family protein [Robertkochia sediminum]MBL7472904.1 alanine:cation symporter family protein [Robertkochia sediminum]